MTCDKIVEGRERFDVSLTLNSNNPQVTIGKQRTSQVRITESTGNDETVVSIGDDVIE